MNDFNQFNLYKDMYYIYLRSIRANNIFALIVVYIFFAKVSGVKTLTPTCNTSYLSELI